MKFPFYIVGIPIWDNELKVIKIIGFIAWANLKLDWRHMNARRRV